VYDIRLVPSANNIEAIEILPSLMQCNVWSSSGIMSSEHIELARTENATSDDSALEVHWWLAFNDDRNMATQKCFDVAGWALCEPA